MKRSLFLSVALAACALACSVGAYVAAPVVAVCRFVFKHVTAACALAAPAADVKQGKLVWFVKAKAFASALAKRERPVLTNSWRMCPSA